MWTSQITAFLFSGAAVVLWDVNKDGVEEVAGEINRNGGHAFPFCCNLRDKHDIQRTAAKVSRDIGDPTILVNNAGIVAGKGILDFNDSDVEAAFDVNILAHFWVSFHTCQHAHLRLRELEAGISKQKQFNMLSLFIS